MEASQAEKNVFGEDVKLHPITKMPLEQGVGALSPDIQAQFHCRQIEHEHGKHLADAMRAKLAAQKTMTQVNADLQVAEEEDHHHHG